MGIYGNLRIKEIDDVGLGDDLFLEEQLDFFYFLIK